MRSQGAQPDLLMHSYQNFISMIENTALTLCYNGFQIQAGVGITVRRAFSVMFDPSRGKAIYTRQSGDI
jgi:hypothetical protein